MASTTPVKYIHRFDTRSTPFADTTPFFPLFLTCRYFTEGVVDPIAVTAGIVQTGLYLDFFYVYFTKYVLYYFPRISHSDTPPHQSTARPEV
jgi:hypothetical protein